jgi:indole-3-glycerol phosphate synthase
MGNILQEIAERTKERIAQKKKLVSLESLQERVKEKAKSEFPFEEALKNAEDIAFICEIKKASPSKGLIAEEFLYLDIAKEYETAGAAAISVLTEPYYFKGSDEILKEIAAAVDTPLLRKDFVVDPYMIYEAKDLGASAVLLICSLLGKDTLSEYIKVAHGLGLSALVEAHDEAEIVMALTAGARVIGVNNRDLKTFTVDLGVSERLRPLVPKEILFVAESGIRVKGDVNRLRDAEVDAVLIGESIMRSKDKGREIKYLKGEGFF